MQVCIFSDLVSFSSFLSFFLVNKGLAHDFFSFLLLPFRLLGKGNCNLIFFLFFSTRLFLDSFKSKSGTTCSLLPSFCLFKKGIASWSCYFSLCFLLFICSEKGIFFRELPRCVLLFEAVVGKLCHSFTRPFKEQDY